MYDTHLWQTPDKRISVSLCSEGCLHVMVGRAVIKMTPEEFFALQAVAAKAAQDLRNPPVTQHDSIGH